MKKATYELLKSQGICVRCKKNHVVGRVVCEECQKKDTENKRILRQKRRESGLCARCGKPLENNNEGHYCSECKAKEATRRAEERNFRKSLGICVDCGTEKALEGSVRCLACKMARREWEAEHTPANKDEVTHKKSLVSLNKYYYRKEHGLCTRCGKRAKQHGNLCIKCYNRVRNLKANKRKDIARSERVSYGICYVCGKHPVIKGKGVCQYCYPKLLERIKKIAYLDREHKNLSYWDGLNTLVFQKSEVSNGSSKQKV